MEVIRVVQMVPETLILKLVAEKDVPKYQANRRASKYTYMTFFTFSHLIWLFVLFNFYINIIYFVMTYFIIRDILITTYLFYYLRKTEYDKWSNLILKSQKRHLFWNGESTLAYIILLVTSIRGTHIGQCKYCATRVVVKEK